MKYGALIFVAILGITSCGRAWAPRGGDSLSIRPSEVADFRVLYSAELLRMPWGRWTGSFDRRQSARPIYLAIADDATIRHVIEEGRPGTAMPAFAQKAGGLLTEAQIDILVRGIRTLGQARRISATTKPPAYAASQPGDAARGHNVFTTFLFFRAMARSGRGAPR